MAALVDQGWPVRALVRGAGSPEAGGPPVEIVPGDVRDAAAVRAALAGVQTVFHLAAKVHDTTGADARAHWDVTVLGTEQLLSAAAEAGVKRLVFMSSLSVHGSTSPRMRDETAPCDPATAYGRAKSEAERRVLDFGERSGTHVVCLRPALVYGVGGKGNLPRMIRLVDRGLLPPVPDVGNRRSVVHVDDVVQAALLAAANPAANGQRYAVTEARPYSARELYVMIRRALGKPVPRWRVPAPVFRALGRVGDALGRARGRRVPFDSEAVSSLLDSAWFSSEKIARELGYRPAGALETTLPAIVDALRAART